jgi:hypothetical protein
VVQLSSVQNSFGVGSGKNSLEVKPVAKKKKAEEPKQTGV